MTPMGDKEPRPNRAGRLARFAAPLLAMALLAAGAVLLSQPVRQESVGWFAYAPLSQQAFAAQSLLIMDEGKWAGVALTVAGLLALAFWSGYRTGRQSLPPGDGPARNGPSGNGPSGDGQSRDG